MIVGIGNEDVSGPVDCDSRGAAKRCIDGHAAITGKSHKAVSGECRNDSQRSDLADAKVGRVADIEIAAGIKREAARIEDRCADSRPAVAEKTARAIAGDCGQPPRWIDLVDSCGGDVGEVDVPAIVGCYGANASNRSVFCDAFAGENKARAGESGDEALAESNGCKREQQPCDAMIASSAHFVLPCKNNVPHYRGVSLQFITLRFSHFGYSRIAYDIFSSGKRRAS